eukprot:CAMPEP_0198211680 /NCGR_PEP_ID=MMETSP1445-20131203/25115_1 /TAXON_ID=36898 /ORGANISM="Pyramimonas sp., Strain CCMP2087" /LENGTH=200 /DNA_ID=CAMNT_0043886001 /DNA_START=152 /DNA_END=751 /DNA_ORIENTATION=+
MSGVNLSRGSSNKGIGAGTGVPLTPTIIKAQSGQFDLEAVNVLSYTGRDLPLISNLEECVNTVEINFSDNKIPRIEGLTTLGKLRRLVLTNNQIEQVESLEQLESLEHLLLQGNKISTLAELNLPLLQMLPKLVSLYLRNVDGSQSNPVCKLAGYRTTILASLPNLRNLDGERLRSTASNHFQTAAQRVIAMGGADATAG